MGTQILSASSTKNVPNVGRPEEYFVDVPFQVWIEDERYNIKQQLSCGFIEFRTNQIPDGHWGEQRLNSLIYEHIIIFNQPYDSTGKQYEYVGYIPESGTPVYANLNGWNPPAAANFTPDQINRSKSPWFDAMYVLVLRRYNYMGLKQAKDIIERPISYGLTIRDTFYYKSTTRDKVLSLDEKKV